MENEKKIKNSPKLTGLCIAETETPLKHPCAKRQRGAINTTLTQSKSEGK